MTTKNQSGIYTITNLETGVMYIGRTAETFAKRWGIHRCTLKAKRHNNSHLQNAWTKYGGDAFEFKVLEVIPQGDISDKEFVDYLNEREIILIDEHDTFENGYNQTEGGGGTRGWEMSEATKEKIGAALKGKPGHKQTAEACAKISKATSGRKHTAEALVRMSAVQRGKTLSEEHKAKIAVALKSKPGHKQTAETRAKISASRKGKTYGNKGKPWSAARRAAENKRKESGHSYAHKGKPWSAARRSAYNKQNERVHDE